jgi:chromosome segregation ATPase
MLALRAESLDQSARALQEEIDEAQTLLGDGIWAYQQHVPAYDFAHPENLDMGAITAHLEDERRMIERLKIKIEDMGGGSGSDVMKEYQETLERDQFLEKEINDLEASLVSLRQVIDDLTEQLRDQFKDGVTRINEQFQNFFTTMFGGGTATIALVPLVSRRKKSDTSILGEDEEGMSRDDEEDVYDEDGDEDGEGGGESSTEKRQEEGVEIVVQLPKKRVRDLQMLSGGERSLTSICPDPGKSAAIFGSRRNRCSTRRGKQPTLWGYDRTSCKNLATHCGNPQS